jgi:hypothetical protein
MTRARKIINEIKASQLKKGTKVKFKKDNFRMKGKDAEVVSVDDPGTGDEDVLVKLKVDGKTIEVGLEELQ